MLKMMKTAHRTPRRQQHGAAAVEFALIAMLFFTLLFGILEFGRLFYLYNSVQEVTRRAAREAVIRWVDEMDDAAEVESLVLFGSTSWPAGFEITASSISIVYLNPDKEPISKTTLLTTSSPGGNISTCQSADKTNCIAYVQVSIVHVSGATCDPTGTHACYTPMIGLFSGGLFSLSVPIPASTVTMPAESMGFRI